MTDMVNKSGYTLIQKIQYMLANGGRSIISALVNTAYIKFYTDFIGLDPKWLGIVFLDEEDEIEVEMLSRHRTS
jgi:Na+/melibiose symporter-like transporter